MSPQFSNTSVIRTYSPLYIYGVSIQAGFYLFFVLVSGAPETAPIKPSVCRLIPLTVRYLWYSVYPFGNVCEVRVSETLASIGIHVQS